MAKPLKAEMPPNCTLGVDCTVEVVAIDPTTGNTVAGVAVANYSIYVRSTGNIRDLASGPFTPVLIPTRQT